MPETYRKQRRARAVELDAHEADARLHDIVERIAEVLGAGIVLIQADADAGRVDLHQLAERILQAAADRDRAALDGVALRKFLAADFARRVHARAGFVDDHVVHVLLFELTAENFGDELFGLPAGGAVADRDDGQIVLGDERDQLRAASRFLFVAADDVDHVVGEQLAEFIERRQLAAVLVARIDGQNALAGQRRLQQQIPQVASETLRRRASRLFRSARGELRAPGWAGSTA